MIKKDKISTMVVDLCEERLTDILSAKCAHLPVSHYCDVSTNDNDIHGLLDVFIDNVDLSKGVADDAVNSYLVDFLRCAVNDNLEDIKEISIKLKYYLTSQIVNLEDYLMQYLPEEFAEAKQEARLLGKFN